MTYTIETINAELNTRRFHGTFETLLDATEEALRLAQRSQPFLHYRIFEGTPKDWKKPASAFFDGLTKEQWIALKEKKNGAVKP